MEGGGRGEGGAERGVGRQGGGRAAAARGAWDEVWRLRRQGRNRGAWTARTPVILTQGAAVAHLDASAASMWLLSRACELAPALAAAPAVLLRASSAAPHGSPVPGLQLQAPASPNGTSGGGGGGGSGAEGSWEAAPADWAAHRGSRAGARYGAPLPAASAPGGSPPGLKQQNMLPVHAARYAGWPVMAGTHAAARRAHCRAPRSEGRAAWRVQTSTI
jgi:hypothetical protein